jgi:hypothetical protein
MRFDVCCRNRYGPGGAFLALASVADPTKRGGWTRHGKIFGAATQQKSGSLVLRETGEHYVIWGCDAMLKVREPDASSSVRHLWMKTVNWPRQVRVYFL